MNFKIEAILNGIAETEHSELSPLPLWCRPGIMAQSTEDYYLIIARNTEQIIGIWCVPLIHTDGIWVASRSQRYFPYMAPVLQSQSLLVRRRVFSKMLKTLQQHVHTIDLPLSPDFQEANVASAMGCFVEWRHTHRIDNSVWMERGLDLFDIKTRNHVRKAMSQVRVEFSHETAEFDFSSAIKGAQEAKELRGDFARHLAVKGFGYSGIAMHKVTGHKLGGVFLVRSDNNVLLYHSWFERDALRGVPSLLVYEALNFSFNLDGVRVFDFEGSVLASVDRFMSSFNGDISPYGHLFWSRDRGTLLGLVENSLEITGRVDDNYE